MGMRYVVPKGFIAIDGTSLTVCDVKSEGPEGENWFTFMLVEYTQQKIIIPTKKVGDTVNIEVDVLGKYSEQAWGAFVPKVKALEGGDPSEVVASGEAVPKGFTSPGSLRSKEGKGVRSDQPSGILKD